MDCDNRVLVHNGLVNQPTLSYHPFIGTESHHVLSKELEVSMSQACHSAGVPSYQQSSRPGMPVYTSTRDSQSRGSASTLVSQTARAAGTQSRSAVNIPSPRGMPQPSSGNLLTPGCSLWNFPSQVNVPKKAFISTVQENAKKRLKQSW